MVGAAGFELATLCSQSRCATGLRYAPNLRESDCLAKDLALIKLISKNFVMNDISRF